MGRAVESCRGITIEPACDASTSRWGITRQANNQAASHRYSRTLGSVTSAEVMRSAPS